MGESPFSLWRRWWSRLAAKGFVSRFRHLPNRDERYNFRQRMIYRRQGGMVWYDGQLENVSVSGILFRGEKPLVAGDLAQVSFDLPQTGVARNPTPVFCWARVVRVRLPQITETKHTLAVKIVRYRSEPTPPPDIRTVICDVRGPIQLQGKQAPPFKIGLRGEKRAA